jgi:hypothetical protein
MPLPSSNPGNRLSLVAQGPAFNIADFSPSAKDNEAAFSAGLAQGQKLVEDVTIRPKLNAAAVAQAEDQRTQANANVELRPMLLQNAKNEADPTGEISKAQAQIIAIKQDMDEAGQEIVTQHAEAAQVDRDGKPIGSQKKVDSAIKKQNKLAADLNNYTIRLKFLTAKQVAVENKSGADVARSASDLTMAQAGQTAAPTIAATGITQAGTAQSAAQSAATAQPALNARAQNEAMAGAQISQRTLGNTVDSAVIRSQDDRLKAEQDLLLRQQGGSTIPQDVASRATELGVPTTFLTGAQAGEDRPTQAIQADIVATNVTRSKEPLDKLREDAKAAEALLVAAKTVSDLLPHTNTGILYGVPGAQQFDQVLAQFGNDNSVNRELIRAESMKFIANVRRSFPGQVSNFEMGMYERAVPGPKASRAANEALTKAAIATGQRAREMAPFVASLVGEKSYDEALGEWDKYISLNPTIRNDDLGQPTYNSNRLSPAEWLSATKDREAFQRSKATEIAQTPGSKGYLPIGKVVGERVVGPAEYPFIVHPSGGVTPNDVYWDNVSE